ncbi:DNA-directed RNA polymerase [Candidatus Woesearchaeota archaeon]|nr:DNA-directed RNA polymerase [Candidatus Woesearchaeota archaeon]
MRRENNNRRDSGFGRQGGFNNRQGGSSRPFGGPREMHKAVCAGCQAECEVPFKPSGDRPVYCRDCFAKNKPTRSF